MPYNARREISSLFDPLVYLMLMSHWELCEILDFQRGTEMQLRSSEDFSRVRTKLANNYHTPSRTPNNGIRVLPWHLIPLPAEHTPSPPNGGIDHPMALGMVVVCLGAGWVAPMRPWGDDSYHCQEVCIVALELVLFICM